MDNNYEKAPFKLYVQDIFRAKRAAENRYVYEMFGRKFKKIKIHGVVTSMYNTTLKATNFELSDPTGCVQIYYDSKSNMKIEDGTMKDLVKSFAVKSRHAHVNELTMSSLLNSIENSHKKPFNFEVGSYVSVVGDIFVDDFKNTRMICGFSYKTTSVERDIIWLEELRYLYEKYYLCTK